MHENEKKEVSSANYVFAQSSYRISSAPSFQMEYFFRRMLLCLLRQLPYEKETSECDSLAKVYIFSVF